MAEEQQPADIPEAGSLEKENVSTDKSLADIEEAERRITHVDSTFDSWALLRDVRFEKILFIAGIGLMIAMAVIVYILLSKVDDRRSENITLAAQVESDFYGTLLKDKDYVFIYRLKDGLHQYDPLTNTSTKIATAQGVGNPTNSRQGGFTFRNGLHAQIVDGSGKVVLELGDTAIHIDDILLAPDGNSVIFDVRPASSEAQNKFGLRLGAYEYRLGEEEFETLVSDASPGISDDNYESHFIRILSFSTNGRYLAYTNQNTLFLYDRLSSASIRIAVLDSTTQEPATAWVERPEIQAEEAR